MVFFKGKSAPAAIGTPGDVQHNQHSPATSEENHIPNKRPKLEHVETEGDGKKTKITGQ